MKFIDGINPISVARNYVPEHSRWLEFKDNWDIFFELEHSDVLNIVELARKYEKDLEKPRSGASLYSFEHCFKLFEEAGRMCPINFWHLHCDLFSITRVLETNGYREYQIYKRNGSVNGSNNPFKIKTPFFYTEAQKKRYAEVEEKIQIGLKESDKALESVHKCHVLFDKILCPIIEVNIEDRELKKQIVDLEKAKQKLEKVDMVIASKANPSDMDSWFLPKIDAQKNCWKIYSIKVKREVMG